MPDPARGREGREIGARRRAVRGPAARTAVRRGLLTPLQLDEEVVAELAKAGPPRDALVPLPASLRPPRMSDGCADSRRRRANTEPAVSHAREIPVKRLDQFIG